jgi:hypothetical protein
MPTARPGDRLVLRHADGEARFLDLSDKEDEGPKPRRVARGDGRSSIVAA